MEAIIVNKTKENKQDFEDLRWCLLANNPKSTNQKVRGILIKDGLIVATDSFRLHMILNSLGIKEDYYTVVTNKTKQIVLSKNNSPHHNFLNPHIFPEWKPEIEVPCQENNYLLFREIYYNFFNEKITWNPDYIRDAWMPGSNILISKDPSPLTPLCIYDNDRRGAMIMPLQVN